MTNQKTGRAPVTICFHDAEAGIIVEREIVSEYGKAEVDALLERLQERARVEAGLPMTMQDALRALAVPDDDADECAHVICEDLSDATGDYINWHETPFTCGQFAEFRTLWCPNGTYAGSALEREVMFNRLTSLPPLGVIEEAAKRLSVSVSNKANPPVLRDLAELFDAIARAIANAPAHQELAAA